MSSNDHVANWSIARSSRSPLQLLQFLAAHVLFDNHIVGFESFTQDLDRQMRICFAAHKDVKGCIVGLRPAVYRDVAFGKHSYTTHSAIWREVMQVDMKKGCPRHFHTALQGFFDPFKVIEPTRAEQIYN